MKTAKDEIGVSYFRTFEEATRGERERAAPSAKVPIWEYDHE